ncbi:MAG: tetratricopeptide repeat protein [Woeseiaceae bacterium]
MLLLSACGQDDAPPPRPVAAVPEFVGSQTCADCHATEFEDWRDSHHDLAMQVADAETVLGDFNATSIEYFGETTEFYSRDEQFFVRTANADGELEEFRVTHAFGVTPLQQYLIDFPNGRLQTLPFAWDTRPGDAGGQRWFHVYGDDHIPPGDELHWTGRQQNWNYMCAECHSTDLQVNYEQSTDSFATTWSEIDVGCEACHGPASVHVANARAGELTGSEGLSVNLDDHGRAVWEMNLATGIAERSELAMRQSKQPEACGRCHSRRGVLVDDYEYGLPLADTHRPALLNAPLYFDDGQILEEVFVYGSFVQSRMYQAGVTCSDCHNPHSLELVTGPEPSDVCGQCHLPTKFAVKEHHQHQADEVACVDCHMPERSYMQVDPRRDHSFRVPRPHLTVSTNSPNACANCHKQQSAESLAFAAREWWGDPAPHYANAFAAVHDGAGNATLHAVINDGDLPGINRATAIAALSAPPGEADAVAIQDALNDPDPLVRMAAVAQTQLLPPETRLQMVVPALKDSVRSVRIEAARVAAPMREYLPFDSGFPAAATDYRNAQLAIASQPVAHVALGDFESSLGNPDAALQHYATALNMDPESSFARLNYADALRRFGDEPRAEELLREGLIIDSDDAGLHHSLGLLLVRTERTTEGLQELQQAAQLAPDNPRYIYVVGIALNSTGQGDAAVQVLQKARADFPADFDIAWALATMLRDRGESVAAKEIAEALAEQRPGDANVQGLLRSLNAS